MKKLISFIIISLIGFSSTSSVLFAMEDEGYIEQVLQIRTGVEGFNIEREQVEDFYFINPTIANVHSEFKRADTLLKAEMMRQYAEGDLDYYQINGMIENHEKFVYYTNKLFYYLSQKERGLATGREIDNAIEGAYINLRSYYGRIKALYN